MLAAEPSADAYRLREQVTITFNWTAGSWAGGAVPRPTHTLPNTTLWLSHKHCC